MNVSCRHQVFTENSRNSVVTVADGATMINVDNTEMKRIVAKVPPHGGK